MPFKDRDTRRQYDAARYAAQRRAGKPTRGSRTYGARASLRGLADPAAKRSEFLGVYLTPAENERVRATIEAVNTRGRFRAYSEHRVRGLSKITISDALRDAILDWCDTTEALPFMGDE